MAGDSKKFHYEFMGPYGPIAIIFGLPFMCYVLYFTCNVDGCISLNPTSELFLQFKNPITDDFASFVKSLWSTEATLVFLGWFALQSILYLILPGNSVQGSPYNDKGDTLTYKLNGFAALLVGSSVMIGIFNPNNPNKPKHSHV